MEVEKTKKEDLLAASAAPVACNPRHGYLASTEWDQYWRDSYNRVLARFADMQCIAVAEQLEAPKYDDKTARDNLLRLKRVSSRFKLEIPAPCVPAEPAAVGWEAYTASDGRPYFVDHNTGHTRWELPAAAQQVGQLVAAVLDSHAAEAAAAALAARDAEEADATIPMGCSPRLSANMSAALFYRLRLGRADDAQ
jgi:hypothetical protein